MISLQRILILFSCFLLAHSSIAQAYIVGISPALSDQPLASECREVLNKYFKESNTKKHLDNWDEEDKKAMCYPDAWLSLFAYSFYYEVENYYKPTIVNIDEYQPDSTLSVTLSFAKTFDTDFANVVAVTDVVLKRNGKKLTIKNPLLYNLKNDDGGWTKVLNDGNTYYYKDNVPLHKKDIELMSQCNRKIADIFKIEPIAYMCVAAYSFSEIQRLRGIKFDSSTSNWAKALSEVQNKLLYITVTHPPNIHEIVHLYTYKFAKNHNQKELYTYWNEGFATWLGGTNSKPLHFYTNAIKNSQEFKSHDFNSENIFALKKLEFNFDYVLAGLLCHELYKKHGYAGIENLYKTNPENIKFFVQKEFNIKPNQFDGFVRKLIMSYSEKDNPIDAR